MHFTQNEDATITGAPKIDEQNGNYEANFISYQWGTKVLNVLIISGNELESTFKQWSRECKLYGHFGDDSSSGTLL